MLPDIRRNEILRHLEKNLYMSVDDLAKAVFVSKPTIRRDLAQMEKEGLLSRKRGGASFIASEKMNFPFVFRNHANIDKKNYIAGLAADYVRDGDFLFLDSSSTCYCLARHLASFSSLNVLTHGIPALQVLGKNRGISIDCVCGTYHPQRDDIYGYDACEYISRRHARINFISCQGLDLKYGITQYTQEDAAIKKAFCSHSDHTILLADSSKIGKISNYQILPLKELTAVVTDQPLPEALMAYCQEHHIEVVY